MIIIRNAFKSNESVFSPNKRNEQTKQTLRRSLNTFNVSTARIFTVNIIQTACLSENILVKAQRLESIYKLSSGMIDLDTLLLLDFEVLPASIVGIV